MHLQILSDSISWAKVALANDDFGAVIKTGVVCRRVRWIGGKDGREVVEYEINTALIESLNSVEKRAAIETGQEVDRQDIQIGAKSSAREALLAKAFSIEELEAMRVRMLAAAEATEHEKVADARLDEIEQKQGAGAGSDAPVTTGSPSLTSPRQSQAGPSQPDTGPAGEGGPSVARAPRNWRD
jgi:hypothetical protein